MTKSIVGGIEIDMTMKRPVVSLPSGAEVAIEVRHVKGAVRPGHHHPQRCTYACLLVPITSGGFSPINLGIVWCSPKDNFCRRTGRKMAASRLLKDMMSVNMPKQDRAFVFRRICPEFGGAGNHVSVSGD